MLIVNVLTWWAAIVLVALFFDFGPEYFEKKLETKEPKPDPKNPTLDIDQILRMGVANQRRQQRINLGLAPMPEPQPVRRSGSHRRMAA